jgi:hypothetical protein
MSLRFKENMALHSLLGAFRDCHPGSCEKGSVFTGPFLLSKFPMLPAPAMIIEQISFLAGLIIVANRRHAVAGPYLVVCLPFFKFPPASAAGGFSFFHWPASPFFTQ